MRGNSVSAQLKALQTHIQNSNEVSDSVLRTVNGEVGRRISSSDLQRDLQTDPIATSDQLVTPTGRNRLADRLNELGNLSRSEALTNAERQQISDQIRQLSGLTNPNLVDSMRVGSRLDHARSIRQDPFRQQEMHDTMVRALEINGSSRFNSDLYDTIRSLGLINNQSFMQAYSRLGYGSYLLR